MAKKKLHNDPTEYVSEMLEGFAAANPSHVRRVDETDIVVRADAPVKGKVGVVTGGGSGHEPMHAGYVGKGMLDGAAAGAVFTSPSATDMQELIEVCDGGAGVLAVVKNYEGDIMNFQTASDLAADTEYEQVIVDDDISVSEAEDRTGRRGVAGTVFVHKIAGAKAAQGASLSEVAATAEKAIDNIASMGVALSSCITPEKGEPTVDLSADEIELGIGIHGEPGVERTEHQSADDITERITTDVVKDLDLAMGDEVVAMVNGLGATTQSELYIVARELNRILDGKSIAVHDIWVGEYCTSLDMAGCSISLLRLDDELRELLNYPVETPAVTIAEP
ncbi:dihydroxyacetone kinase subunit DhaK [Halorubrum sp. CBA1125]|uniref:dihydroxyacetone kinase subunit DhaK n=1 Tax=Halorubrum sp. CBA1125 TaxID=2668072 RepID=UPI0012E8A31B|nr:dihydroxyacetone kinase subunit DhaK [Halorubrum sp. CBA1125]MUW13686.1 dihydroxyacetone kinase subunit DhaK [Halorubrum sp. CBA1125]